MSKTQALSAYDSGCYELPMKVSRAKSFLLGPEMVPTFKFSSVKEGLARSSKLEARSSKLEAGSWTLDVGSWKLEAGS